MPLLICQVPCLSWEYKDKRGAHRLVERENKHINACDTVWQKITIEQVHKAMGAERRGVFPGQGDGVSRKTSSDWCLSWMSNKQEKREQVWTKWVKRSEVLVAQSCATLCDSMDCSPSSSSVHGLLQARILAWVAISFFWGFSWPRDRTRVSCTVGSFFTIWATREAWVTYERQRRRRKHGISPE